MTPSFQALLSCTFDMRKQTLVLGAIADEPLESSADHGVLSHQDNGLASKAASDLVHLLRRDIVDTDLGKIVNAPWQSTGCAERTMKIDLYSSSKPLSLSK